MYFRCRIDSSILLAAGIFDFAMKKIPHHTWNSSDGFMVRRWQTAAEDPP
jgi:hypothetical protein